VAQSCPVLRLALKQTMAKTQDLTLYSRFKAARDAWGKGRVAEIEHGPFTYADSLTSSSLMGNGVRQQRSRQLIYQQWQDMQGDAVVSAALRMHCTGALGGHETTGDMVFVECKPEFKGNKPMAAYVDEINKDLGKLFNSIAMGVCYNGVSYGDAYGRLYTEQRRGVVDICADEMMMPPLVQPYEVGSKTVACTVAIGQKARERLTMDQIARLKMPRMIYTPQPVAVEKSWRYRIAEDNITKHQAMPALAGGSFLAEAEDQFYNMRSAMAGLVGQRALDSLDESIFTVQVDGMTKEQQTNITANIAKILKQSKDRADEARRTGQPIIGRFRYLLPIFRDKQVMQVQAVNAGGGTGGGRAGNISIDDVLFHAKLLAGALGIDLAMLGFADMLAGGLGDGGFFRTSVQAAERSRSIRTAAADFYSHICRVHIWIKHRVFIPEGQEPWVLNFYGNIAAMETERQKTSMDAANTGLMMAQLFAQLKDSGLGEEGIQHFLERVVKMDEEDAKLYAGELAKAIAEAKKQQAMEGGFGGDGGGGFGGPPGVVPGQPAEDDDEPKRTPSLE
jgi:hypothetical protein